MSLNFAQLSVEIASSLEFSDINACIQLLKALYKYQQASLPAFNTKADHFAKSEENFSQLVQNPDAFIVAVFLNRKVSAFALVILSFTCTTQILIINPSVLSC